MSKSKKIIHKYKSKSKYGGIERHIQGLINQSTNSAIKKQRKEGSDDILMFHGMSPDTILEIIKLRFKTQIIYWTPHFHPVKFTKRPIRYYWYLKITGFILFILRCKLNIIFLTKKEKEEFSNFFKIYRSIIIPLVPIEQSKDNSKDQKNIDFIYVARNDSIKDVDLYIRAAQKFQTRSFVLICDISLINQPENLKIIKNVTDEKLEKILRNSYFFISTSKYEAMGLAIIEAESHGTPAIVRVNTGYLEHVGSLAYKENNLTYETEQELFNLIQIISDEGIKRVSEDLRNKLPERIQRISLKKFINSYEKFIYES